MRSVPRRPAAAAVAAAALGLCLAIGGGVAAPAWATPAQDESGEGRDGQGRSEGQDGQAQSEDEGARSGITIEVEAGIGGWAVFGDEYPVHVTVATDRLIDGLLRVRVPTMGGVSTVIEREVEITGGSTARIDLVAPAWPAFSREEPRVELVVEDEVVAQAGFAITEPPDGELVGLLPDLVAAEGGADSLPSTVPLVADLGEARPVPIDTNVLALGPLALGPLDQLVTGAAELAALPDEQQVAVAEWVQSGGQLLLAGDADALADATGALPADWQPTAGGTVIAGLGRVRSVGDDWTEGLLPSPTDTEDEQQSSGTFAPFSSFTTMSGELGQGAGLHLPGGVGMGLLLAGYVLVCGPAVYLVMRRLDRRALAWVAIPVLAVGSTGITFQTGSSLRKAAGSAQVTVYESGPAGTVATTWSLLANPRGGEVGVELPSGWLASVPADTSGGGIAIVGADARVAIDAAEVDPGASDVRLDTGNGTEGSEALVESEVAGYSLVESRGPVADMGDPLEVEATVDGEGLVSGTVRNTLDVDLDDVVVFVGHSAYVEVGTVGAGDRKDFTVEDPTALTPFEWPDTQVWPSPGMEVVPDGVVVQNRNVEVGVAEGGVAPGAPDAPPEIVEDEESFGVVLPAEPAPAPVPTTALPDPAVEAADDAKAAAEAEAQAREQPAPPDAPPVPLPAPAVPDGSDDADDDSVILAAWAATQQRTGSNYRPVGQAVAVGWTSELDAPAQPSSGAGPTRTSYSAVVARTTIAPEGTELAGSASVRSLVQTLFGEVDESHDSGVWAFQLPETVDGEARGDRDLVLDVGVGIDRLEVWTPDGWEVVHNAPNDPFLVAGRDGRVAVIQEQVEDIVIQERVGDDQVSSETRVAVDPGGGLGPAPPTTEPGRAGQDQAQAQGPTTVDVPRDAVVGGVVLCRWSLSLDLTGGGTGEVTIHDKEASR